MVDSIGSRPVAAQDRLVVPVVATPPSASAAGHRSETATKQLELSTIAFDFGKKPPVDEARVAEVRKAVREGTYPIFPETIADRLLALKLNWSPKK